ncbi:hypothetical protein EVAR_28886_1 [Eumeta japonica]|uniref:Uncharacterized protein n=1 Tax=Eumeta variegata TaxID=151549 RepID=A0A4C1WXM9_EUMVA|nr:hypothetical protein EVAR_28886_1 [Eumeta japonica]
MLHLEGTSESDDKPAWPVFAHADPKYQTFNSASSRLKMQILKVINRSPVSFLPLTGSPKQLGKFDQTQPGLNSTAQLQYVKRTALAAASVHVSRDEMGQIRLCDETTDN